MKQYVTAVIATSVPVVLAVLIHFLGPGRDAAEPGMQAALTTGPEVLEARCGACHEPTGDGGFNRLTNMRKSPEGWDMTITRMDIWHRVQVPEKERRILVKYLSDTLGLAPTEAAPWRYALEQDYNRVETPADDEINYMCARCHSYARIALQRRDEDEWRKLAHTHLGQYPSMEFHEKARNEEHYWEKLRDRIPLRLDVLYPFETRDWTAWKAAPKPTAEGSWRITGEWPGAVRYTGTVEISATAPDEYATSYSLASSNGTANAGQGTGIVYTGYEWRGLSRFEHGDIREVYALSADGSELNGRWYEAEADERGVAFHAVRVDQAAPRILAVDPPYLRAGEEAQVSIHGFGLSGEVSLGSGVGIAEVVAQSGDTVTVIARANADANVGTRIVNVGDTHANGLFNIYHTIGSVRVEPVEAIARVGGAGGPIRKIGAQFNAIAYLNGADGEAGTADDVRLGGIPASWSVENFDELAVQLHDADFTGAIDERGYFTPADAGVNPARAEHGVATNNAGTLNVVATVADGEATVTGKAHLVVTVQRWVRPPIR